MIIINQKTTDAILEDLEKQLPGAKNKENRNKKEALLKELKAIDDKYNGKHIRATLYQLSQVAKGDKMVYDPTLRKVKQLNCLVECQEFIDVNWRSMESGRIYELDEAATEKQIADFDAHLKGIEEKKQMEDAIGAEMGESFKAIATAAKARVGRPSTKK